MMKFGNLLIAGITTGAIYLLLAIGLGLASGSIGLLSGSAAHTTTSVPLLESRKDAIPGLGAPEASSNAANARCKRRTGTRRSVMRRMASSATRSLKL